MTNPIAVSTRGRIYLAGVIIGVLAVVAGPMIVALQVPDVWAAVITSLIGAVTTLTTTLARANLTIPGDTPPTPESVQG